MTTETQTTEQALAKILMLCKNNGKTLDELLKIPLLDADEKINITLLPMEIISAELNTGLPWEETKSYSYPDIVCCPDGNTYRCIGENITGEYPPESDLWVRITVIQTAGNYDMESGGTFGDAALTAVTGGQF